MKGLFALHPNLPGEASVYPNILQYAVPDPTCAGASLTVFWSQVDQGPQASPQYDWSSVMQYAQPWIAAGKKVNLLVWGVAEQDQQQPNNQSVTPQYVLDQVDKVEVSGMPATPVFWEPGYINNYEKFMQAVVREFGNESWIGYIRFGIGVGGEDYPENNFNVDPQATAWAPYGLTEQKWTQYSLSVLDFESTLNSPKLLMVGINQFQNKDPQLSDAVAARAVQYGFGFGTQGLTVGQIQAYESGQWVYANWAPLFNQYAGQVPLEIQTTGQTSPPGTTDVGSLVPLLPFALQRHAQIFELYPEEWLVANDPSHPNYKSYHDAYHAALVSAAAALSSNGRPLGRRPN
jgi:hypothetical protein